jgi:hypothetical protein
VSDALARKHSELSPKEDRIGTRLPIDKIVEILKRYDSGHSVNAICSSVGSDCRTVGAVIRRHRDRAATAKAILEQSTVSMAAEWLRAVPIASARGDHRPAKELLQACNVVAVGQTGTGGEGAKVAIQVIIGTPDSPIPYDPVKS